MTDPRGWSLDQFAEAYRDGATVTEVVTATLAMLDALPDGVLIGAPLHEAALEQAALLDGADATPLPLYGVPFVVKDNIDVGGAATTVGCPGTSVIANDDAAIVALLRQAGAVVVGKTNLDQFATGLVGTRSPYGIPPNTIDPALVPGGSSSGSAVAVALGVVPFSLGTDTAGSGRVPAALNGIVGLKPTLGSASTRGIVPAMRRIDCPSVFARTVADAAAIGAVIRRPDPNDPFARQQRAPRVFRSPVRVGVVRSWPSDVELDDDMEHWYARALDRLGALGCELHEIDPTPMLELGALLYGSTLVAERTVAVGDAVDKGVDGLDPVVATIVARGSEYSANDAYRTEYEVTRLRAASARIWDDLDLIAIPTTPRTVTIDDVRADPFGSNEILGRLTTFVNLADLAAIVVPDPTQARRPAGLQLIAPAWHDIELERIAAGVEQGRLAAPAQPRTLVVVGAHLAGLALNHQLVERRATLLRTTRTAPDYRLYALAGTVPPKPGLLRVAPGTGASIEVEVWSLGDAELGSFVAGVPAPLCIGTITLADGTTHLGFLCEPEGLKDATDITESGGWRAHLAGAGLRESETEHLLRRDDARPGVDVTPVL